MKAIFLSDAHLLKMNSPGYRQMERFLRSLAEGGREKIERLYILGDFFDFWFAKGTRIYEEFEKVVAVLVALRKSGVRVYFAEGNHEFFTREYFQPLGIEAEEEHFDFVADGSRFFVAHGDDFCSSASFAHLLKLFLKSEVTHTLKTVLPLRFTWWLSRLLSQTSRRCGVCGGEGLATQMRLHAEERFGLGYDVVIFGHAHFSSVSEKIIAGKRKVFVTLGDWLNEGGSYLQYRDGVFEIKAFA